VSAQQFARLPAVLGGVGLLAMLLLLFVASAVGPEVKSPEWMEVIDASIVVASALAVVVVALALRNAIRWRRAIVLVAPCLLALLLTFLTWGLLYPSQRLMRMEIRETHEVLALIRMLVRYVGEHDGYLPGSLQDLIDGGYIRRNADGTWASWDVAGPNGGTLRDPARFNVAWGIHARDVDSSGHVIGQKRMLVEPLPDAQGADDASMCRSVSSIVGRALQEWQAGQKR
jgi:hypothetical protein